MTDLGRAVFLSYASQDAEAVQKICEALRAAGIEVFLDQSELRGGDAWDQKIRREIRDCALFIPVISANTVARGEGYFRLEWSLAEQRSHMVARNKPFIVPVCLDRTPESVADVPESFQRVQWTRLLDGNTPPAFPARIVALLGASGAVASVADSTHSSATTGPVAPLVLAPAATVKLTLRKNRVAIALMATIIVILACVAVDKLRISKHVSRETPAATASPAASAGITALLAISEKSIAVLPFVDLSEKHDQEYFADGMAEEILNLLVKIPELRVIGRTSSFSFKGKQADLPSIGRALGVTYLVEGSVRRSGDQIRVTAQLIDARNGTHRWSDTFEGAATDMLKLQDTIAVQVAHSLGSEVSRTLPPRATINSSEAYDYYLRAIHELDSNSTDSIDTAHEFFQKALALAPQFAPAAVGIAETEQFKCLDGVQPELVCPKALTSVETALRLDPRSADAYAVRAQILIAFSWDWSGAAAAVNKATEFGGGLSTDYAAARLAYAIGDMARARRILQRIIASNPFEPAARFDMGFFVELRSEHYAEAESWIRRGLQISPKYSSGWYSLGVALLMQGKLDDALATMKEEKVDEGQLLGLILVYAAQNRKADSYAALEAMQHNGSYFPSDFAHAYAFRGELDRALADLEKAYDTHDPFLWYIKGDPLLRNLEGDPRYKAFLRKMNLPQ